MPISAYDVSVPVFVNGLNALSKFLAKAEVNAAERKIDPQVLLAARLAPDMFPLTRQVQIATDHAKGASSRLTRREIPKYEDLEASFADLQERLSKTIGYIEGIPAGEFAGAEDRTVEVRSGGRELQLNGLDYLQQIAKPNFYFHLTTAYDILRHNGVPIGKRDFLGTA